MVGEAVLCARGGASTIQFIPWWANSDLGRGWVPELLAMAGRKTATHRCHQRRDWRRRAARVSPPDEMRNIGLLALQRNPTNRCSKHPAHLCEWSDRPDQAVQHTSPQAAASCTMTLALYYLLLTSIYRTTYLCLWLPKHEPCQFQWRSNVNSSAREVLHDYQQ